MVTKYTAEDTSVSVFTTELNGLTDGTNKITGTALSNDAAAERDILVKFRLHLAQQATARAAGAYVDLYLIPEENGTFAYGGDALNPAPQHRKGRFHFDATLTARDDIIVNVVLPPGDFHVLLSAETGEDFAATGNTLDYTRLDGAFEDV